MDDSRIEDRELAALLRVLPETILLVGPDRRIRFINRAVEGYDRSDLIGADLLEFVAPESRESQAEMFEHVLSTEEPATDEIAVTDAEGNVQWHEGIMIPMTSTNGIRSIAIVTRNVTGRRRAEEEAKKLRGLVPVCSWCKKIRDDEGFWQNVEAYLEESTASQVTHGMCPDCEEKLTGTRSDPQG